MCIFLCFVHIHEWYSNLLVQEETNSYFYKTAVKTIRKGTKVIILVSFQI